MTAFHPFPFLLGPIALLAACAAPQPRASSQDSPTPTPSAPSPAGGRTPLAPLDGEALIAELIKDLHKGDAAMPKDDDRGLLGPTSDAVGLLVAFGPALGVGPETSPRWNEVQDAARAALARLDDPRVLFGAQTQTFVLNDINLDTLRAGQLSRLATDPELRLWRGLLLDLSGREEEARGWFAGLLADSRPGEQRSVVERQWNAWRAWRDQRPEQAALEQAEAVRLTWLAEGTALGARELRVADLGLLLQAAGHVQDGEEVLRTLMVRTIGQHGKLVTVPTSGRPSWGSQLAESALRARGASLEPGSARLVSLVAPDVALIALQGGENVRPDTLQRLVFAGRLGGPTEPWQLWFAEEAPLPLLRGKAEVALTGASLRTIVSVLELLDVLSGTLAPYVDDVVRNLARYPKGDTDDVAAIDDLLRARLGLVARATGPALRPAQFIDQWSGWTPAPK